MSIFHIPFQIHRRDSRFAAAAQESNTHKLQRQLLLTWAFISQEGLLDEAMAFVRDHKDTMLPFIDQADRST